MLRLCRKDCWCWYLLTLAAIAKEITYRQADRAASVHLAAGLPLTSFGRDKKKFRDYLYRGGAPVSFRYEGEDYRIAITEVSLFPQGYAAVLTQSDLLDELSAPMIKCKKTPRKKCSLVAERRKKR